VASFAEDLLESTLAFETLVILLVLRHLGIEHVLEYINLFFELGESIIKRRVLLLTYTKLSCFLGVIRQKSIFSRLLQFCHLPLDHRQVLLLVEAFITRSGRWSFALPYARLLQLVVNVGELMLSLTKLADFCIGSTKVLELLFQLLLALLRHFCRFKSDTGLGILVIPLLARHVEVRMAEHTENRRWDSVRRSVLHHCFGCFQHIAVTCESNLGHFRLGRSFSSLFLSASHRHRRFGAFQPKLLILVMRRAGG